MKTKLDVREAPIDPCGHNRRLCPAEVTVQNPLKGAFELLICQRIAERIEWAVDVAKVVADSVEHVEALGRLASLAEPVYCSKYVERSPKDRERTENY